MESGYSELIGLKGLDNFKRLAQAAAASTKGAFEALNAFEIEGTRGESAYHFGIPGGMIVAFVLEGPGTKAIVADQVGELDDTSYYHATAQDTAAMNINDLIIWGASPYVINIETAVRKGDWFDDGRRSKALVDGFVQSCALAGCVWGGGETPALFDIIEPGRVALSCAGIGFINPGTSRFTGNIRNGDAIIFVGSSGVQANGITTIWNDYVHHLEGGWNYVMPKTNRRFGETILEPTIIYASLIKMLADGTDLVRYAIHVTGHGQAKIMRAKQDWTYLITDPGEPQEVFEVIQDASGRSDRPLDLRSMYCTYNMGVGYVLIVDPDRVNEVLDAAHQIGLHAWQGGHVTAGPRRVQMPTLGIELTPEDLDI